MAAISEIAPTEKDKALLEYLWPFWARPKQLAPAGGWSYWLLLAGRGFGKTRSVTEWARHKAESMPGSRGAIVSATAADARDIVVEGESGIIAVCPPWNKPIFEPSKRRLTWPNGSIATLYTADQPNRLRGPQHHWGIADELAAWRYPDDAWSNLLMGMRLGELPQIAIATTPRPIPIIRDLLKDAASAIVRGTTYENVGNLAPAFFKQIITKYEGTRLGRQELNADLLDDVPGALWTHDLIDKGRVKVHPELYRIVVAVDPAASSGEGSNDTGIVVTGIDGNQHGYVLDDLTMHDTPAKWGEAAVLAYDQYKADRIVAEVNHGGDMVAHVIATAAEKLYRDGKRKSANIAFTAVRASKGKYTRAEPISALYEQGRVHHVGALAKLEDQMCTWLPGEDSPDRLDAAVWGLTELMIDGGQDEVIDNPWW